MCKGYRQWLEFLLACERGNLLAHGRRNCVGIFLLISGGLTCAFFLYVLLQFHRELTAREEQKHSQCKPAQPHSPKLRFRSVKDTNHTPHKGVMGITRATLQHR
jgi:hypothetical protein